MGYSSFTYANFMTADSRFLVTYACADARGSHYRAAWAEGRQLTMEQAIEYALEQASEPTIVPAQAAPVRARSSEA